MVHHLPTALADEAARLHHHCVVAVEAVAVGPIHALHLDAGALVAIDPPDEDLEAGVIPDHAVDHHQEEATEDFQEEGHLLVI